MSRAVKIVAICVVMVLLAGAVTGVAVLSANYKAPPEKTGLVVDGKLVEDPGVMVTVGDVEIPFADYRYYYLTYKKTFDMYFGDTVWDTDFDGSKADAVKEQVESVIQRAYALQILAQEENITLSEEEIASIDEDIAAQKSVFGDEFEDRLREMYYTDEAMYRRITEQQMIQRKAQEEYTKRLTDEKGDGIIEDARNGYITAKHILIAPIEQTEEEADTSGSGASSLAASESTAASSSPSGGDATSSGADGEEEEAEDPAMQAAYARAEELRAEILASKDPAATFDALMLEYGEDPGVEENPDGYTFTEGEMVEEFYEGAKALEVGEISEPIKTAYGYHIIMRMPLDEEYVDEYITENRDTIIATEITPLVNERIDKIIKTLPVTPGEYYSKVSPSTIK